MGAKDEERESVLPFLLLSFSITFSYLVFSVSLYKILES